MAENLRADIQTAKNNATSRIGSGREIKKLVNHLWPNETVHRLITGVYAGKSGLLVRTNRRLLFLKEGVMSQTSESFGFDKISSVQWDGGMVFGKIRVFTAGNTAIITQVPKDDGRAMIDEITHLLGEQV